jgi:hypothetical protein
MSFRACSFILYRFRYFSSLVKFLMVCGHRASISILLNRVLVLTYRAESLSQRPFNGHREGWNCDTIGTSKANGALWCVITPWERTTLQPGLHSDVSPLTPVPSILPNLLLRPGVFKSRWLLTRTSYSVLSIFFSLYVYSSNIISGGKFTRIWCSICPTPPVTCSLVPPLRWAPLIVGIGVFALLWLSYFHVFMLLWNLLVLCFRYPKNLSTAFLKPNLYRE